MLMPGDEEDGELDSLSQKVEVRTAQTLVPVSSLLLRGSVEGRDGRECRLEKVVGRVGTVPASLAWVCLAVGHPI